MFRAIWQWTGFYYPELRLIKNGTGIYPAKLSGRGEEEFQVEYVNDVSDLQSVLIPVAQRCMREKKQRRISLSTVWRSLKWIAEIISLLSVLSNAAEVLSIAFCSKHYGIIVTEAYFKRKSASCICSTNWDTFFSKVSEGPKFRERFSWTVPKPRVAHRLTHCIARTLTNLIPCPF